MNKKEYQRMAEKDTLHWWFLAKRLYLNVVWRKYIGKEKKKILDLGSGTGGVALFLQKFGDVTTLEKYLPAVQILRKRGLRAIPGNIARLPFSDSTFDVVTFLDVLYHQQADESAALKEAHRVLRPGGTLVIFDSASPALWSEHDRAMHAKKRFTLKELDALTKNNQFFILKESYFYFFLYPFVFLVRKILFRRSKKNEFVFDVPPIINWLLLFFSHIEAQMLSFVSFPIGSSAMIIARKPGK